VRIWPSTQILHLRLEIYRRGQRRGHGHHVGGRAADDDSRHCH
jgi:hypothetical protein